MAAHQLVTQSQTGTTCQSTQRPITICVEGNIGCGKTTLLNYLGAKKDVMVLEEPVHKWRNVRGKNLLDLMYQDPVRWSHLFQTYVQLTMMQQHLAPCKARVKVLERSIHSARHCFVENLYQSGKMSEPEYNVYCEWYKTITCNMNVPVDLIVYMSASPEVVYERIKQRGRLEELGIPLSYLRELHDLHMHWLQDEALPAPLLVLPNNMTLEEMGDAIDEHLNVIAEAAKPAAAASPVVAPRSRVTCTPPVTPTKTAAASN